MHKFRFPRLLSVVICCIVFMLPVSWPATGQDALHVLRAEHNGVCKSLIPGACSPASKKSQKAPAPLTRSGDEVARLRKKNLYENRLVERYSKRLEEAAIRRAARKTITYSVAVNEQDSLALVALYNATDGANWTDNTGWLTDPVSDWFGVTVNEFGYVVELDLRQNFLFGNLPDELTALTELLLLDLYDNFLMGTIPSQIGDMSQMEVLDLSFNLLNGSIPFSMSNMTNLFDLVLWGNNLSGVLPVFIANFQNLEVLSLEFNRFEGPIPAEFGNLTNLVALFMDQNQFAGTIPAELGNLSNLVSLFLGSNDLSGGIPVELLSIEGLQVLSIANAGLSGTLPPELANLTNLTDLDLGVNLFEGPIPDELMQMFMLSNLYLNDNLLTGEIPVDIGGRLINLVELSFGGNFLEGTIPPSIGGLLLLRYLDLGFNQLSGTIPDMNQNQRLNFLYLDQNNLEGEIANQFFNLFAFIELNLSGNNLSGEIPISLAASPFMSRLWLADNTFFGTIPAELTSLENLELIDLWNNELEGSIPAGIVNQTNLQTIDMGWNALSGPLPDGMDQLDRLSNLFLDINALSGAVPESLTGADTIRVLILNDNFLTKIPDLSLVTSLDSVSLGNNLLGFDSIEPNLGVAEGRISYAPQRPLPMLADELDTTIRFSADIGGSSNQYQWFLGNTGIPGATQAVYEAAYTELVSSDDLVLEVANELVPNLILATEPVRADARLSRVVIAPISQTVASGDSIQFEYAGLDQFGDIRRFSGMWSAEGGIIDQSGLYIAGNEPGEYTITVNNSLGAPVGEIAVTVSGPVSNEEPEQVITAFALGSNFPNPFSGSTEITVEIPETSHMQLKVYNVLGQEMTTLVDQVVQPGTHRYTIHGADWPAGMYFYTLQAGGLIQTHTMVKVH